MRRAADATLIAGGSVLAAALLARRWGPDADPDAAAWYRRLNKAPYTPPSAVIGGAWASLDALLALAGARLLMAPPAPARAAALAGWSVAVAGIPAWMAIFFGARRIGGGLAVIGVMVSAASATTAAALRVDRLAASCVAPLIGWLGFAGLLNAEIARRNR